MQLSKTIAYGDMTVEITVRGKVGYDKYVERVLFNRLYEMVMGTEYKAAKWFTPESLAVDEVTALINRTVSVKGLPITWAQVTSDDKSLCESFEYTKQIPEPIWSAWIDLVAKASEPPGDPDTLPPEALSDDKKKTPKS